MYKHLLWFSMVFAPQSESVPLWKIEERYDFSIFNFVQPRKLGFKAANFDLQHHNSQRSVNGCRTKNYKVGTETICKQLERFWAVTRQPDANSFAMVWKYCKSQKVPQQFLQYWLRKTWSPAQGRILHATSHHWLDHPASQHCLSSDSCSVYPSAPHPRAQERTSSWVQPESAECSYPEHKHWSNRCTHAHSNCESHRSNYWDP